MRLSAAFSDPTYNCNFHAGTAPFSVVAVSPEIQAEQAFRCPFAGFRQFQTDQRNIDTSKRQIPVSIV